MEPKKATCEMCGKEFPYYAMAKSAMDVGQIPKYCDSRECKTNVEYQKKTRNMQTGEYTPAEKIRKL